jgi:fatty-acyl-CoA synthase
MEGNVKDSPYWPEGLAHHLSSPQPSLYGNLETSASRYPGKTAIHYYGGTLSYAQLQQEVEALAGFLQRQCAVARGDRVALYMQNSPQYVIGYYAILRANAVVVPVNPMNTTAELRQIIEDCGAKVVLLGEELTRMPSLFLAARSATRLWRAIPTILLTTPTCRCQSC